MRKVFQLNTATTQGITTFAIGVSTSTLRLDESNEMNAGLPYPFSSEIYAQRQSNLRETLKARGLDGVLLFDQSSKYYLFGFDQLGYWVFQAVWFPTEAQSPVQAICRAPDKKLAERGIGIDVVKVWLDDDPISPTQVVVGWLRDSGVKNIGIELSTHALVANYALDLSKQLTDAGIQFADATDAVMGQREVKEPSEIEYLRQAGEALDDAYRSIGRNLQAGMFETEVSSLAQQEMLKHGCDPSAVAPCISSGERTLFQTHLSAKQLPVENNDILTVELGASVNRYHAVGYLTYFFGDVNPRYVAQYESLRKAVYEGIALMKPGASSRSISTEIHRLLDEANSSRAGRHVGYATGIGFSPSWLEHLRIKDSQDYVLTPGMNFFIFVGAPTYDGARHMGFGLPVIVTEDGHQILALENEKDDPSHVVLSR